MRPVYETAENREREKNVITYACKIWNCTAVKTPRFYPLDWSLQKDGQIKAFAEVKYRSKIYPTYLISAHKWQAAINLSEILNIPALLVICWPDENDNRFVIWTQMKRGKHHKIIHGGRFDRNDEQDSEPMVELNLSVFKRLE